MANSALRRARHDKVDEFYTQLTDIEKELSHYSAHFENKVVFCNCDDPFESNFFKYFALKFNQLKLKKLIATCYDSSPIAYTQLTLLQDIKSPTVPNQNRRAYKIEINEVKDFNGDGAVDLSDVEYLLKNHSNSLTLLNGNGDFRSDECVELLKTADIVVTNPPFSLFREYVAQLITYCKKFVIIGNQNAITYKEIFPLIQQGRIWLGYKSGAQEFAVPSTFNKANVYVNADGKKMAKFGNICWFTNLDTTKRHENLQLYKKYTPEEYPKYDNYDAINVDKVTDIPYDYLPTETCSGEMGVPITFLDKHNPNQFDIVRFRKGNDEKDLTYTVDVGQSYRQTDRQTDKDNYAVLQNCHPSQSVTESWAYQSPSSTNSTLNSLKSSVQPKVKEKVSLADCGTSKAELPNRLSAANENTNACSCAGRCNGIMGVPITFLDRYNPEQFEIIGLDRYTVPTELLVGGRLSVGGKTKYARILIRRKQ